MKQLLQILGHLIMHRMPVSKIVSNLYMWENSCQE